MGLPKRATRSEALQRVIVGAVKAESGVSATQKNRCRKLAQRIGMAEAERTPAMADGPGFEPGLRDSESRVLPVTPSVTGRDDRS